MVRKKGKAGSNMAKNLVIVESQMCIRDRPRDVPNAFVVEVQSDDGVVLSSTQAYPASQVKK